MNVKEKRILITGATGGIGESTAELFVRQGAHVALLDLDKERLQALAERLAGSETRITTVAANVTDSDQMAAAVRHACRELGGLDVLFNNAGVMLPDDGDPVDTPLEAWNQTIAVNATGVFLGCKHGIPALLDSGGGSIINTASIVAQLGSCPAQIAYTASKGAVLSLTREVAVIYARRNIRANAICPGVTRTKMTEVFVNSPETFETRRAHIPMGRMGEPAEVAALAVFLASDEASYITAQTYHVDGGMYGAYLSPPD